MIGPRVGPKVGPKVGPNVGQLGDGPPPANTTLTVAITDSTDPVITAVNFNYSTIVTNTGAATANSVTAIITLDASLAFVSGSGTGWSVGAVGQVVTCTRATLTPGAAPTITVTVTSGGSALTATSTADASASNAPAATQANQTTVVKLVTKDATDGRRFPNTATEWSDFIAYNIAIGTASFPNITVAGLCRCDEASGNLTDQIGAVTLTANGTPLYQQTVTGMTRKAVGFNGAANQRFTAAAGIGPSPATTSQLWCAFGNVTATPGAASIVMSVSDGTTNYRMGCSTAPVIQSFIGGVTANGTSNPTSIGIQPFVIQYDRTNSNATCYTGQDKILNTFTAGVVDGRKGIGGSQAVTGQVAYIFRLEGANAEITAGQVKSLLVAMGNSIPW